MGARPTSRQASSYAGLQGLAKENRTISATRASSTLLRKALEARTVRYVLAGGTLAVLGAALLTAVVAVSSAPAGLASLATSLVVAPATYFTHRNYTFRSENQVPYEMGAFLSVFALNYPLGAALIFVLVDLLQLPTFWGALLATALLPVINYLLHTNWVFRKRRSS